MHNQALQGTSGQRGFSEFSLAAKSRYSPEFGSANPAGP